MKLDYEIRKKALRAMQAVTASAVLFAGVSCSSTEGSDDSEWNLHEEDAGNDVTTDTNGDASGDTNGDASADASGDTGGDASTDVGGDTDTNGETDVALSCNDEQSTGVCPEGCTMEDDVDCCHEGGGCWDMDECWEGGCAVPGPFVPPRMVA